MPHGTGPLDGSICLGLVRAKLGAVVGGLGRVARRRRGRRARTVPASVGGVEVGDPAGKALQVADVVAMQRLDFPLEPSRSRLRHPPCHHQVLCPCDNKELQRHLGEEIYYRRHSTFNSIQGHDGRGRSCRMSDRRGSSPWSDRRRSRPVSLLISSSGLVLGPSCEFFVIVQVVLHVAAR